MTVKTDITAGDHVLTPVPVTPESLAGYGWVMGQPGGVERDKIDVYGREVVSLIPPTSNKNSPLWPRECLPSCLATKCGHVLVVEARMHCFDLI